MFYAEYVNLEFSVESYFDDPELKMNDFNMFKTNNILCSTKTSERPKISWTVNGQVVDYSNNLFILSVMEKRAYLESTISILNPKLLQPNTKLVCTIKSSSEKSKDVTINTG